MLNILIRLAALMGSYFGWWEYFRRHWKVDVFFVPAFTLAVHFTLLFLPGLLNFLEEMSLLLYFGGMVLALDALRREKLSLFQPYITLGYGVAIVLFAMAALGVRGMVFAWFDSFTHWATVVKNMLLFDRFPTFAQSAVGFPSYPLGSSTLIYYFCNVTSDEESMQMLAQNFVSISMLLPVFAYVKKRGLFCGLLTILAANFFLCYNTPFTELLVDSLLPLCFVATIAFIRQESIERQVGGRYSVFLAFPMLFLLLNMKNAALFFLAVALVLLLVWQKQANRPLKDVLWVVLALAVGYFLWDRHCDYVYLNSDMTQHAISGAYLQGRLAEKSPEVIATVAWSTFRYAVTRGDLRWLLGCAAALGVLTWVGAPGLRKSYGKLLALLAVLHLLYTASLAGMYVFSMSKEGALGLECIERYMRIMDIAVYYVLLIYSVTLLDTLSSPAMAALTMAALSVGGLWTWFGYGSPNLLTPTTSLTARRQADWIIGEYGIAPGHRYLLLCEDGDLNYQMYVYRYCLNSPDVTALKVTEAAQLDEQKDYQYIIIEDMDNPVIQAWIQEHYPDRVGQQVIQDF